MKISTLLAVVFLLVACDSRELALDYELPYEGQRIAVQAVLRNGQQGSILITRNRPIGDELDEGANRGIPDATVIIWEDGQAWQMLKFAPDTSIYYEIRNIIEPDGVRQDTVETRVSINNLHYISEDILHFREGAAYHLTVIAPGYPDVRSEVQVYQDIISLSDLAYKPPLADEFTLLYPSIAFTVQMTSNTKNTISVGYAPYYADAQWQASLDGFGYQSFQHDIDAQVSSQQRLFHTGILFYRNSFRDVACPQGCSVLPDGGQIIVTSSNPALTAYYESLDNNSEYLGGFFQPNPYIAHNVAGGYGVFGIIEQDTLLMLR